MAQFEQDSLHFRIATCTHCDGCGQYPTPIPEMTPKQFYRDLTTLSESGTPKRIVFEHEPLENFNILSILRIAAHYHPNATIVLKTNGRNFPTMSKPFWETIKNAKIIIQLSPCPTADLPTIESILKTYNVECQLT